MNSSVCQQAEVSSREPEQPQDHRQEQAPEMEHHHLAMAEVSPVMALGLGVLRASAQQVPAAASVPRLALAHRGSVKLVVLVGSVPLNPAFYG